MRFASALVAPLALAATASARFVMYYDEWHPSRPTDAADRAGVDHLIMAFAKSNDTASYKPHVPIATIKQEYPQAKIMVAIGGWGDTTGFSAAAKSDAGITKFASDIKTMLDANGLDGVDIDWEYPGGNGADYIATPNSEKANEITAFPKMLTAIREAIGKDKILSIAVPGKTGDMLAFTAETGKTIWPAVDFVNVMSYDLMNRRDKVTAHHTSVKDCTASIKDYTSIGCPAEKLNLGFAYYAKYFTTAGDCGSNPLGCPIVAAEKADGSDALTSGAFTFEKANMASPNNATMAISSDGTCGPDKGKCPEGSCCSQYGNCGTTAEHCNNACQFAYGTGCQGPDIAASWQKALVDGATDKEAGGQYYFDASNKLFWTWDTPELIDRKYTEIVKAMGVGGVMAWSLGEDSYDWSHVKKLGSLAGGGGGGGYGEGTPSKTTTTDAATPTPSGSTPSDTPPVYSSVNHGVTAPSGTGYPAIPSPSDAAPVMPKPSDTIPPKGAPSDTVPPKASDVAAVPSDLPAAPIPSPSGVTPPTGAGTGTPAAPKDDGYEWEETCTRRRVKKRSVAAKHIHAKRGHVGNAFLA